MPAPTWPNHHNISRDAGMKFENYFWYDETTKDANFERAFSDIEKMPEESPVLLHACAHNPTGCDL